MKVSPLQALALLVHVSLLLLTGCDRKDYDGSPLPSLPVSRVPSPLRPGGTERLIDLKPPIAWAVEQSNGARSLMVTCTKDELCIVSLGGGLLGPASSARFQSAGHAWAMTHRILYNNDRWKDRTYYDVNGDGLPDYSMKADGLYHLESVTWEKVGDASAPDPLPNQFPKQGEPVEVDR